MRCLPILVTPALRKPCLLICAVFFALCLPGGCDDGGGDSSGGHECRSQDDCPEGEACVDCRGYSDGSNCKVGQTIEQGYCLPTEVMGTDCTSDADCAHLPRDDSEQMRCFDYGPGGKCELAWSLPYEAPASRQVSDGLCGKLDSCGLSVPDCGDQIAMVAAYVVEPDDVVACFSAMSCSELEQMGEEELNRCLDYDFDAFQCSGENSLEACNSSGACIDIDCSGVCRDHPTIQTERSDCGFVEKDGYDKCRCYL